MKGYEEVKEFLESELGNYSYFSYDEIKLDKCYEQDDEDEYYYVEIKNGKDEIKTISFHYDRKNDKLEILLGEENFHEVTTYDWKVKYFWMALLEW